ncbi:uncharacterized protein LOC111011226 [Momordica charantia]|uniref:Uncharacterized protein LOC111011226 n=1 Tax=Momordica charantia TaxID=3673 RepID=A0A6J1CG67_MOMCH|nr:uncharacterized protein LOC111011226 [Momordica charantia]
MSIRVWYRAKLNLGFIVREGDLSGLLRFHSIQLYSARCTPGFSDYLHDGDSPIARARLLPFSVADKRMKMKLVIEAKIYSFGGVHVGACPFNIKWNVLRLITS